MPTLLGGVIDTVPRGLQRATALNLLAGMQIHLNSFAKRWRCSKRRSPTPGTSEVRVRTMLLLSFAEINAGEFVHAMQYSERAVMLAEEVDNPDLTSQVLSMRAMVTCMCGNGFDAAGLRRANALEDPDSDAPIALRASATYAVLMSWAGRLDEAAEQMSIVRRRCTDRGAETDLIFVSYFTTLIEVWRGRYAEATSVAEETVERAEQLGGDHLQVVAMTVRAVVGAYTGRVSETREAARGAIELAQRCGSPRLADWSSISLGFLEVSLGNYAEALTALQPLIARFDQVPGTEIIDLGLRSRRCRGDVSLGRLDEAEPLIDALEANGRWLDRPWMLAVGARCRSMLLAAHGRCRGAVDMAEDGARRARPAADAVRTGPHPFAARPAPASSTQEGDRARNVCARRWRPSRRWALRCGPTAPAPSSPAADGRARRISGSRRPNSGWPSSRRRA